MELGGCTTLRLVYVSLVVLPAFMAIAMTPSPPTIEAIGAETITDDFTTGTIDEDIPRVSLTEQVMDVNIQVSDMPDVDPEFTDVPDISLDRNRVIRDVAYYIRTHKFNDFDRRYFKNVNQSTARLYEEFPKPGLRSLHWEARKHCDVNFVECLKYLERIVRLTGFKREDDTVTVMRQYKWTPEKNSDQIQAVQTDCRTAQKRDDFTTTPFQGPIERFQWRTTVSYYMCWYTMLGIPDLATFGEPCDNHANCLDEYGVHNKDPRADDTKPFACALYSFCPDHCCPMKHIWYMKDCFQSPNNPCYAENQPANRKCTLNREENQDFQALRNNRINISCECQQPGYEWSSRFGLCVDVNECTRGTHNCTLDVESCMNLPGRHACICRLGNIYDDEMKRCVSSPTIQKILEVVTKKPERISKIQTTLEKIVQTITRSAASDFGRKDMGFLSILIALTMRNI